MLKKISKWLELQKKVRLKTMGHVPSPPPPRAIAVRRRMKLERKVREENPAVKDAWEKYQITLKLVIGEADDEPTKFGKRTYNTGPK